MNKYRTELLERLDKKANCKVGKQCGDICIPKKSECQLNAPDIPKVSPELVKGVGAGAGILGMSTASYLAFRAKYRAGFAESAQMAEKMANDVKVDDIPPEQTKITFATGGFYGSMGAEGKKKAEDYFSYKLKTNVLDADHHVITHRNDEFNIPESKPLIKAMELDKEGKKPDPLLFTQVAKDAIVDHYKQTLETALIRGRNPEAVKLASEVIAYNRAYPDKEIYLTGHSAGGMINHEAAEILDKLKIKVNVVNFGSGYFGLTEKVGNSATIVNRSDFYFKTMAGVRDPIYIGETDKIADDGGHAVKIYMNSPEIVKTAKSLFNQKQNTKKDSIDNKGRKCGDSHISKKFKCKKNGEIQEVSDNTKLAAVALAGAGVAAIALPVTTIATMRHNYIANLPKSAEDVKRQGKAIDPGTLKDFGDKQDILFYQKGFNSHGDSTKLESHLNSLFENSGTVVRDNKDFNFPNIPIDSPDFKGRFIQSAVTTTIKPILHDGRNPESVALASEVYAYHLKYPDKPINIIGHSAGGMIVREASDILNKLEIKHNVAAIASPDFGLFNTKNYMAINSDKDPLSSILPNAKATKVSVEGHTGDDYLSDAKTVDLLKNHFKNNIKTDAYYLARTDAIKKIKAKCKIGKPCGDICIPKKNECESDKPKQQIDKNKKEKNKSFFESEFAIQLVSSAALLSLSTMLSNLVLSEANRNNSRAMGDNYDWRNAEELIEERRERDNKNREEYEKEIKEIRQKHGKDTYNAINEKYEEIYDLRAKFEDTKPEREKFIQQEKDYIAQRKSEMAEMESSAEKEEGYAKMFARIANLRNKRELDKYEKDFDTFEKSVKDFEQSLTDYTENYHPDKKPDIYKTIKSFHEVVAKSRNLDIDQSSFSTKRSIFHNYWQDAYQAYKKADYQSKEWEQQYYRSQTTTSSGRSAWTVLGISENASEEEINKAYKALMRKNHPDLFATASPETQKAQLEKTKQINEAKDMLDAILRRRNQKNRGDSITKNDSALSTQERIQLQCKILDYLSDAKTVDLLKNHFKNNMKTDAYYLARADAMKKAKCKVGKPCGDICIPKKNECKNESIEESIARQQKEYREYQKKLTEQGRKNTGTPQDIFSAIGIAVGGTLFNGGIILATANIAGAADREAYQTKAIDQEISRFNENKDDEISKLIDIKEYIEKEKQIIGNEKRKDLESTLNEYSQALLAVEQERDRYERQLEEYKRKYSSRNFKPKDRPFQDQDFQNLQGTAAGLNMVQSRLGSIKESYEKLTNRLLMYSPLRTNSGKDAWSVLGLDKNASESEVNSAYKKLAKQYHPDLHTRKSADVQQKQAEKMQEIGQAAKIARRILTNRKVYKRRSSAYLLPPTKPSSAKTDSSLTTQERIQLQCKILLARATKESITKISNVKTTSNGSLSGLFSIKNKTFKFDINDKNITYSAVTARIDSFQRFMRFDAKKKKCKIGIACGETCIGSRKKCELSTSAIAKPSEMRQLKMTASKLFVEQNPINATKPEKPVNDYEINPDTKQPYTIRDLKKIAGSRGIFGYGSMTTKELKESLALNDKDPDSGRRIAESITKRRTASSRLIDAAGLKGKNKGAEGNTKKAISELLDNWKRIEALSKFAGNNTLQWSAAAVGAFLIGTTVRTYEKLKEDYRDGFDESAKIAQERAAKINLQHPEESNGKPVIRNGKQVMTSKIKQDNITFAVGSGKGHGAEEIKSLLLDGEKGDKSDEWLKKSHYIIPFNLQETGSPKLSTTGNPAIDAANDVVNGFGDSMRNWRQKRNQDSVDLAAQIYAHAIAVDQSDGKTLVNENKKINLLAHGYGGQVTKEALEILARMEIKGSPSGKEVLKQVNAVYLGTPHFGFAENVSRRQRTIVSQQDPVAMLPTFGDGARQQWISSVPGHAPSDYLKDPRVRESVKEAFGYYQGSPEEIRRTQRKKRAGLSFKLKSSRTTKPPENKQNNSDSYDIQYLSTIQEIVR